MFRFNPLKTGEISGDTRYAGIFGIELWLSFAITGLKCLICLADLLEEDEVMKMSRDRGRGKMCKDYGLCER